MVGVKNEGIGAVIKKPAMIYGGLYGYFQR